MIVIAERMHYRIGEEFVVAHDEDPRNTRHLFRPPFLPAHERVFPI